MSRFIKGERVIIRAIAEGYADQGAKLGDVCRITATDHVPGDYTLHNIRRERDGHEMLWREEDLAYA